MPNLPRGAEHHQMGTVMSVCLPGCALRCVCESTARSGTSPCSRGFGRVRHVDCLNPVWDNVGNSLRTCFNNKNIIKEIYT